MLLDVSNAVVPSNKDTIFCEKTLYIKDRVKGRGKENLVLPQDVKPFLKAPPRKGAYRKRVRSAILTNSPIENALCEELNAKFIKKDLIEEQNRKKNTPACTAKSKTKSETGKKRKTSVKTTATVAVL